jgi:hypothetical protein
MRNTLQLAASLILLASQVHSADIGNVAAAASEPSASAAGVYEVKLNTNTASAIQIVGPKTPDYDAEVLAPLHAAQAAEAASKAASAAAKAKAAAAAKAKARQTVVLTAPIPGSHTDWMREAGIAESDFGYVDYIIDHESGWGVTKSNYAGSGAYGLGQAMPASKMAKFGADYLTNPITQLRWANAYAVGTYGSWSNAYAHWLNRHNW